MSVLGKVFWATGYKVYRTIGKYVDLEPNDYSLRPRTIEYAFAAKQIASRNVEGRLLDVGCTNAANMIPLFSAMSGIETYGIDIRPWTLRDKKFVFTQGDIRHTKFSDRFFDCICAISTVEHIGLKQYSQDKEDSNSDKHVMEEIERIIKPSGILILTVPFGIRKRIGNACDIYDSKKILDMSRHWNILEELYYNRINGEMTAVSKETAEAFECKDGEESLGMFVMAKV